jgi:hypothetical protein
VLLTWAQAAGPAAAAAAPGWLRAQLTARLPWVLLLGVALTEGLHAALPGLLGVGAGAVYEALIGLPTPPQPKKDDGAAAAAPAAAAPAATAATAATAAAAGTGAAAGAPAAENAAPPSKWSSALKMMCIAYVLGSLALADLEGGGGSEAKRAQ